MRFLPTYLAKCPPPRDVQASEPDVSGGACVNWNPVAQDPMTVACMVHCITFQADRHLHGAEVKRGATEIWSTPNHFVDLKEGASEDHAILQCNLFLGMGLDAYVVRAQTCFTLQ